MASIQERPARTLNGFVALILWLGLAGYAIYAFFAAVQAKRAFDLYEPIGLAVLLAVGLSGFFVVQPNEARVLVFFGRYVGSVRASGFFFANPFAKRSAVSLRVHNFNSERLKVNDARGNPIEIAAVIVWRVTDTAKALLDVESYKGFVAIQSETAIRSVATRFPYDSHHDAQHEPGHELEASLRGHPDEVSAALLAELQMRLQVAGLEILEARLSHLAYAPEIAQAMLRRQQADAIVAARRQIVDGAVGMVEIALRRLEEQGIVNLDEERKASMVNNLLVALVAEREVQPVINTSNLYS